MLNPRSILIGLAGLATQAFARSSTGDKVLVVLESGIAKSDYSSFWSSLEGRGFELTFAGPKDDKTELTKYGEAQYDHLILYAPSTKAFSKHLSPKAIIDAQLSGLNTLYLLSSSISETQRETLREYDVEFSETGSLLLDAFSRPASTSPATVLLPPTSCLKHNGPLLSNSTLSGGPIVFPSGAVHSLGQNPYLVEVAHAPKTAYVGDEKLLSADESAVEAIVGGKTKGPIVGGRKASLVSALQTRDNARIGFVGSGAVFSDEYWGKKVKTVDGKSLETGNAAFAEDFSKWIFQESGVIKVVSSTHHRDDETEPRDQYTKKDQVTYSISLSQYTTSPSGSSGWGPVYLPDLQLDFTMLDPHIRTSLKQVSSSARETTYSASFMAPDRHGVFKFVVEYWRPGWTYVRSSTKASVVPLRHDQHPRWVSGAWPFYTSTVSISASFLLFCGLWIALGEGDRKGKKKAE